MSPNQFYVGSHFEVPLGSPQFVLRPSIDGGTGDGVTLASINFEFLYRFDLPANDWAIHQGTGPAVNFVRFREQTDVRGGFNLVFGVRHESGFFSELKRGGPRNSDSLLRWDPDKEKEVWHATEETELSR